MANIHTQRSTETLGETSIRHWDRDATAKSIPFGALVEALATAALEYRRGEIHSPERLSVPLAGDGVSLSMPASASDVAIHKLVNVQPANAARGLPSLHGLVTVSDASTGRPLCLLDGPELTGRRTAGISLLGIRTFLRSPPERVLIIGTGVQASYHVKGLNAVYPDCHIVVKGRDKAAERAFCEAHATPRSRVEPCDEIIPSSIQVAITLTTSKEVVYDESPREDRLVIGVGAYRPDMAELGPRTLAGSAIYADDVAGARHEAGDLMRAGVDWSQVSPLAIALTQSPRSGSVVLKSVGTAAWDLAAARVALQNLKNC